MQYELAHKPSYTLAVIQLSPGESIRCESGAMVSMSAALTLEASMNSGGKGDGLLGAALGALKRKVLGNESFFITTIKADQGKGGEVTLAPTTPGDIVGLDLSSQYLIVQAGSYLASGPGIELDTSWGGLRGLIGGEGLFFLRVGGQGTAFITSFGAIHQRYLHPGERYIVDSGHLVAYEEGMTMTTRMAAGQGGFFKRAITSATSGEGLVMEFTGPGNVYLQTRNPEAFSGWLANLLPKATNTSSGSGIFGS